MPNAWRRVKLDVRPQGEHRVKIFIAVILAAVVIGGFVGAELMDSSFSITGAVVGGVGTAAILLGLGAFFDAQERKRREKALTPEMRAVFDRMFGMDSSSRQQHSKPVQDEMHGVCDRMLGRESQQAPQSGDDVPSGWHLPRHLVPPPGHHLKAAVATGDMFTAIDSARDPADKAAIFITRCFDNALHCDAREWSIKSAREAAERVFSARIARTKLDEMQMITEDVVRLGYRAAMPLDLEVMLGTKADSSWQRDLATLVAKARRCMYAG